MLDRFARVNGIELHYVEYEKNGPTLLLFPGLTANAHCFDGLLQAGLDKHFHILALDLRGRGLSDKPASGYGLAAHATDVIGLLDALPLERALLGGHSFGGLLTLYVAAHYPDRVEKIVIMDAAARLVTPTVIELIKPSLERLGKRVKSWEVYLDTIKRAPFYEGWWDPTIESYFRADVQTHADGSVQARSRPENIMEVLEQASAEDWLSHLAKIPHPAILLRGTDGFGLTGAPPVVPVENAQQTVARLADCRYAEIPGNHMTMLYGEGARCMVTAIEDFLLNHS
ncbi:MAG: alpha/beta fold hydrolase [Acidobacteria bacterium]|nr:alpha/beta fold hydrolase [Acidobacteriota bacterium]